MTQQEPSATTLPAEALGKIREALKDAAYYIERVVCGEMQPNNMSFADVRIAIAEALALLPAPGIAPMTDKPQALKSAIVETGIANLKAQRELAANGGLETRSVLAIIDGKIADLESQLASGGKDGVG